MRIRAWTFISVFLFLLPLTLATQSTGVAKTSFNFPKQWTHSNVLRTIDLSSPVVRETISIAAQNIDDQPALHYYFTISADSTHSVAHVTATIKNGGNLNVKLDATESESLNQYYQITFKDPVPPNDKVTFTIRIAVTHILSAVPKEIPQMATQYLFYRGNVFFLSPYNSENQKITVKVPTEKIASYSTGEGVTQKGNTITYGPYTNVDAFTERELRVHFEQPKAAMTVPTLTREFQVSHWLGEVNVQEDFFLRNDGSRLKGHFSRLQYQQTTPYHNSIPLIKQLTFKFPAGAHSAYYKDDVGNVSTSNFREAKSGSLLEIKPRYPIFGGWNYTWFHGYTVSLETYLRRVGPEKYSLKIPFVENLNEMTVDRAILKVILPEGARDVEINAPFDLDSQTVIIHHTYLSSTGHPVVTIEKHNVVKDHTVPIFITYTYPAIALLQKPLVATIAISALFLFSMIWGRIPKTIGEIKHTTHHHHHHHSKDKKMK